MSSIAPGPLLDIQSAGDPVSVSQYNFEVVTRDLYKVSPTFQNGVATTTLGPPTTGSHALDEVWKDSAAAAWRCTSAGTPGSWRQVSPAVAASLPSPAAYPEGYRLQDASDAAREYSRVSAAWKKTYASSSEVLDTLASRGVQGGLYWYDSGAGIATTTALTGILRGAGVAGPTIVAGLTSGRLALVSSAGASLSNSVVRDDGSRVSVGADPDLAQLAFQVTGGISLIGASTIKTSVGEMTFLTGNSLAINFSIGGSNGWRIRSNSVLESVGAQTVATSTGDLTLATGAANGNIVLSPHGRGALVLPRITSAQKNAIVPVLPGMAVFDTTLGKACVANNAGGWETVTSA